MSERTPWYLTPDVRLKVSEFTSAWDKMIGDAIASGEDSTRIELRAHLGAESYVVRVAHVVKAGGKWAIVEGPS